MEDALTVSMNSIVLTMEVADWRDVLPASSMCLAVPIVPMNKSVWPDPEQAERLRTERPATSSNPEVA